MRGGGGVDRRCRGECVSRLPLVVTSDGALPCSGIEKEQRRRVGALEYSRASGRGTGVTLGAKDCLITCLCCSDHTRAMMACCQSVLSSSRHPRMRH